MTDKPCPHCGSTSGLHPVDAQGCADYEARNYPGAVAEPGEDTDRRAGALPAGVQPAQSEGRTGGSIPPTGAIPPELDAIARKVAGTHVSNSRTLDHCGGRQ